MIDTVVKPMLTGGEPMNSFPVISRFCLYFSMLIGVLSILFVFLDLLGFVSILLGRSSFLLVFEFLHKSKSNET